MPSDALHEQLSKYLSDALSIEEQALAQLRTAPKIAGDPRLAEAFSQHLGETERHERLVREALEARGGQPPRFKKLIMEIGGKGFILFARSQPDTPGKLTAHAYSYEALEQASYELLARVARRAGDDEVAGMAEDILFDEYEMADRLADRFDVAAAASLRDPDDPDALHDQLESYLADAHAIEGQSITLLEHGMKIAGAPALAAIYERHLGQSRDQQRLVEEHLRAIGGGPSRLKDAAMRFGALNWATFFRAQPDTPGKLAAFAYAFEHLEIAGYELLKRVAQRSGDAVTIEIADRILEEERATAQAIKDELDRAMDATLQAQGVA